MDQMHLSGIFYTETLLHTIYRQKQRKKQIDTLKSLYKLFSVGFNGKTVGIDQNKFHPKTTSADKKQLKQKNCMHRYQFLWRL